MTETEKQAAPRKKGIDADALLASLAPVVAKPDESEYTSPRATDSKPEKKPVRKVIKKSAEPTGDEGDEDMPSRKSKNANQRQRAKLDVEINPGEGSTAIYVRVPRTTHLALKIQALQNQAEMEGPTEIASIVRTAIGEYLERQQRRKAA